MQCQSGSDLRCPTATNFFEVVLQKGTKTTKKLYQNFVFFVNFCSKKSSCQFVLIRGYESGVSNTTGSDPFLKSRKVWSIVKHLAILGHFLQANDGGKL